jgi:hypothetical protein
MEHDIADRELVLSRLLNKTFLTLRMIVDSAQQLEEMKKFGAVEGGVQTLDRLEQYLAESS